MRFELLVHRFIQTGKPLVSVVTGMPAGPPSLPRLRGSDERWT